MPYKVSISKFPLTRKIPEGDPFWKRFNASFDNLEVEPNYLMRAIYSGQSFTTWHKDHWRVGKNYLCGQHLGLDFDAGDAASSLDALKQDPFISKYGSFLYTTMSHTPEQPRTRAVFLLDTPIMQGKNYALAASALLWSFRTADRKCRDAVRFFYGSLNCEFINIGKVLPIEQVKRLILLYQDTQQLTKPRSTRAFAPSNTNEQEIVDALNSIDPWSIEYDEWLSILMALHTELGDRGYDIAERWAEGEKGEVARKWKSFKGVGNTSGTVTIKTLFKIAMEHKWVNPRQRREGSLSHVAV